MTPERETYLNQCSKEELVIRHLICFFKSTRKEHKSKMVSLPHFKLRNGKRTFSYRMFSVRVAQINKTIKSLKEFLPKRKQETTQ